MELWYAKWEIDIIIKQGWSGLQNNKLNLS